MSELRHKRHIETFQITGSHAADWDVGSPNNMTLKFPREFDTKQCQLCGRHGLSYTYPIHNKSQKIIIMVGSECVKTWVESLYEMPYGKWFKKLMRDEFKFWVSDFFGQYARRKSRNDGEMTQPEKNLAMTIYDMKDREIITHKELKAVYTLAIKLDFALPNKIRRLWDIK